MFFKLLEMGPCHTLKKTKQKIPTLPNTELLDMLQVCDNKQLQSRDWDTEEQSLSSWWAD